MSSNFLNLLCLFGAIIILGSDSVDSKSDDSSLFLGKYPIPEETPDPINIDTSKAHDVPLPPIILLGVIFALTKITNTGELVKATLFQPATLGSVTGGPLGTDVYEFYEFKYYWTNDAKETAAESLDGEGFPFQTIVFFRNKKYPTASEAFKHRDGFAAIVKPFRICSTPNTRYNRFGTKLKEIRQPGSSTLAFLGTLIKAVDFIPLNSKYYSYPGSYTDNDTGKEYYCTTVIFIPPSERMCFTEEQFKTTFGSLKNSQGGPLTSTLSQHPANMPIVKGKFVLQPALLVF